VQAVGEHPKREKVCERETRRNYLFAGQDGQDKGRYGDEGFHGEIPEAALKALPDGRESRYQSGHAAGYNKI
jgi:hypothetical protein